jgi:hypothetical protein
MERISLRALVRFGVASLVILALASFAGLSPTAAQDENEVDVQINELNGSGVSGDAVLTDNGDGTTTIDVLVEGATGDHPMHLHAGTCAELGDIVVPLNDVNAQGESVTDVPIALSTILEQGPHAINIHLSADEIQTYIACGDVPTSAGGEVAVQASPAASPTGAGGVTSVGTSGVGTTSGGNMGFLALAAAAAALIVVTAGFGLRRRESGRER